MTITIVFGEAAVTSSSVRIRHYCAWKTMVARPVPWSRCTNKRTSSRLPLQPALDQRLPGSSQYYDYLILPFWPLRNSLGPAVEQSRRDGDISCKFDDIILLLVELLSERSKLLPAIFIYSKSRGSSLVNRYSGMLIDIVMGTVKSIIMSTTLGRGARKV